jgi:hypothetical protein
MTERCDDAFVANLFPVEKAPRIPTLDRPVLIESACPGIQRPKLFPAVPTRLEDQIREQVDAVQAGATILHMHPRDPDTGRAANDFHRINTIVDAVADATGTRPVVFRMGWDPWATPGQPCDYVSEAARFLELGRGNAYIRGNVFVPLNYNNPGPDSYVTNKTMVAGVAFACAHGIKPVYQLFDTYSHIGIKRLVIDTGIDTSERIPTNIPIGKHDAHAANLDPWSHIQLITSMEMVRKNIPGGMIGV